jgi:predicted Zn-dependent peptidase
VKSPRIDSAAREPARRRDPLVRQEIVAGRVGSGLSVTVVPMPGFTDACAALLVRYGAIDLEFEHPRRGTVRTPPGIAHFLEHELFKKGETDALLEFGRYGAGANAYTDYAATVYHFKGSGDFERCLALLLDFTLSPWFDERYIERERKIIEQELRMYEDSPDFIAYRNLMQGLFTRHPLRLDIGGEVADLARITRPVLEEIFETFYRPANMVLVAAGDLEPRAVFRQVEQAVKRGDGDGVRRVLPNPDDGIAAPRRVDQRMASRPRVLIGFKDPGRRGAPDAIQTDRLLTGVGLDLAFGRTGDFWRRHYESGLIDETFSYAYRRELDFGFTLVGGETDEPQKLAEEVIREARRLRRRPLKSRDVARAKKKRMGRYLATFDHPESAAFYVLDCRQHGVDVFDIPRALGRVHRAAVEERLRAHLKEENVAVSIVNPAG